MSSTLFLCQLCNKPLKLSPKIRAKQEEPLEAQHHASTSTKTPASGEPQATPSSTALCDLDRMSQGSASCSFTLLGEFTTLRTLDTIQNTTLEIFEIISGQKEVDHPLCEECTDGLLKQLDDQLTLTESDNQTYRSFLERESAVSEEKREAQHMELCSELRGLQQEEARLSRELEEVDHHHARVATELRTAEAESKELSQQEEQLQKAYSALKMQQLNLMEQLSSVENQLAYTRRQLRHLKKASIFNLTFTILDDGPLGIINKFRLGCLPRVRVGWDEISAAWGQTALLLFSLAKTVGLQFQRYELVPCGNHSYLKSLTGDEVLLLFSDGSHSVFLNNKFDLGMMAFLDCLQQLVAVVEKDEGCLCLPYRIHVKKGMLEDAWGNGEYFFIRTHLNTEEEWTTALKFMLTNLKVIVAWVSLRYCQN